MTPEETDKLLDEFKAANVALEAKIADLQARTTLSDQQLADLQAEIQKVIQAGK